jgi:hypothetical protein
MFRAVPESTEAKGTPEILDFRRIQTLRTVNGRSRPQTSQHLSPSRRSEGNYTSLRYIRASGGTKSTSAKSQIHQDPDCAELCADPALATSRFSPSFKKGANRRNRHGVGMG